MQRGNEEADLARRLMQGDMSAFEPLATMLQNKLFQYSYLTCGQREDAEEVAQETLLRVFQSFDQLREPEKFRPWLFTIARNVCYMRRRKSIFAPEEEISLDELMPSFKDDGGARRLEIADWSALPDAVAENVIVPRNRVIPRKGSRPCPDNSDAAPIKSRSAFTAAPPALECEPGSGSARESGRRRDDQNRDCGWQTERAPRSRGRAPRRGARPPPALPPNHRGA